MAYSKVDEVLEQFDAHKQYRANWEPQWRELATFVQPSRSDVLYMRTPGHNQTERLFDSTAIQSNVLLAASMQGSLTSDAVLWFGLAIRDVELGKDHALRKLLDQCSTEMYADVQQSNFASESAELYRDLGWAGLGGLFADELPNGSINHISLHPGEYCIDEDAEGYVDSCWRSFQLTARAAVARWASKSSEALVKKAQKTPGARLEFVHYVGPNGYNGRDKKSPWIECYIDVENKALLQEGGYPEFPFMFPRWSKTGSGIYGSGPGHTALADIKTLNKAVEMKLRAWALMVNPPMIVRDEGVVGTVKLAPFGLTHVRDMEAIKPLWEVGGRLDVANLEEDKLRAAIRRAYYADQLQMQEGPQMTAYEVQVRFELMQRVLGPTLGRLKVEWLNPYVSRQFWSKLRRSKKDSPFRQVAEIVKKLGKALDVEYESPLARAQRLQESVAVQRFFQIAIPLNEINPEVMDKVNFDEVMDLHAFATGVPARIMNDEQKVTEIRAGRQKAQEEQAKANQQQQTMDTLAKGAGAAKALADASSANIVPPMAGNLGVPPVPGQ